MNRNHSPDEFARDLKGSQGISKGSDTKPLTVSKGWLYIFRSGFGLKHTDMLKRLSANEETAVTFAGAQQSVQSLRCGDAVKP